MRVMVKHPSTPPRKETYVKRHEDVTINPYSKETQLLIACKMGDLDEVMKFISEGIDPSLDNNKPLERACENGHDDIAGFLLKHPGVSFRNNSALGLAKQYGHNKCLELYIPD